MPLYQLVLLFVFFTGFASILQVPGLKGADADLSLLKVSKQAFAAPLVGVIGAAGVLTALVPGSMLLLTGATILAKNVYRPIVRSAGDATVTTLARAVVPILAVACALLALRGGEAIVPLLLLGYNFVTQLFPALVLSLGEAPLATPAGAMAGILTGEIAVVWFSVSGITLAKLEPGWPGAITDLNIGIVAMAANVVVLVLVSAVTRGGRRAATVAARDVA
jgi:SSS family solute:Na+ symporter